MGNPSTGAPFRLPVTVLNAGEPGGVASLGPDGKVPASQLPDGLADIGDGLTVDDQGVMSIGPLVKHSTGVTDGSALYGVQGEGYATQSSTPTPDSPQPIMVARGRNLIDSPSHYTGGNEHPYGTSRHTLPIPLHPGTYSFAFNNAVSTSGGAYAVYFYDASDNQIGSATADFVTGANSTTVTISGIATKFDWFINTSYTVSNVQLELGTTPTPYVPYGHVGLEVTANGQTTVTPVPLPSKGFLGALPDGTKDTLSIDSAGRVEWVNASNVAVFDGSETWDKALDNTYYSVDKVANGRAPIADGRSSLATRFANRPTLPDVSVMGHGEFVFSSARIAVIPSILVKDTDVSTAANFKAWVTSNPFTVLYPLATPTIESGYIDLPALPEGATVTIPELDNVGVDYWVKGIPEVTEYGQAMQARLQGEIDEAEQAIADNSAALTAKTGFTSGMNVNFDNGGNSAQLATLNFTCIRTGSARYGHRLSMLIHDTGLILYDTTSSETVWSK